MLNSCPVCFEYGMYCQCEELKFRAWYEMWTYHTDMDKIWEHNIDVRPILDTFEEWDEYISEKYENSLPSLEELKQREKEEIEMLIDLGFE
jgi:hypothetical protein